MNREIVHSVFFGYRSGNRNIGGRRRFGLKRGKGHDMLEVREDNERSFLIYETDLGNLQELHPAGG